MVKFYMISHKFLNQRKQIAETQPCKQSTGRDVFSALEEVTGREFCDIVKQNLNEKVKYNMISEKIFELILRNGMTQKEFSEETGISQSTISDWKRKGTNPSADKILKICEVLKVTPYELLGENETERNAADFELRAVNAEEKEILEGFRNLPGRQKERILGYLAALQEER
mgnify:CR=1 FL=1